VTSRSENIRLLDKMSKIMVRSKDGLYGWFDSNPSDILRKGSAQRNSRMAQELLKENQELMRRILEIRPYYSCVEWQGHTMQIEDLKQHM
jgi:hypothetical protein